MSDLLLAAKHSVCGYEWRQRSCDETHTRALMQKESVLPAAAEFMTMRALHDDYQLWLQPSLKEHTPPPKAVTDMTKAATRLADALMRGETIGIISDYDVDGVTAAAQWVRLLRHHHHPHAVRIPHRIKHGYGPHAQLLKELTDEGAKVLLSLDGGTASGELWQKMPQDVDVIVIDHHLPSPQPLPVYAFVNPHRHDDKSGLTMLCASGLNFLLLIELRRILREHKAWQDYDLLQLLAYACLGTLCDMVPLRHFNRVLSEVGLRHLRMTAHAGLKALMTEAKIQQSQLATQDITFGIGPRLNAAGRMKHADDALRLLTTDNEGEAFLLAKKLDELNRDRRRHEQLHEAKIIKQCEEEDKARTPYILARGDFPAGVVGLLASRLAMRYHTLALVLYHKDNDSYAGSVRSANGVHIGDLLHEAQAARHIEKGGGHKGAGGLTLAAHQWNAFDAFLKEHLQHHKEPTQQWWVDFDITLDQLPLYHQSLKIFAPWGMHHPPPLMLCRDVVVQDVRFIKDGHLRCRLLDNEGVTQEVITFRAYNTPLGRALHKGESAPHHLLLRMDDDGKSAHIIDCAPASIPLNK